MRPGRQNPRVLEPLAAEWYFERDKSLPFSGPDYTRPRLSLMPKPFLGPRAKKALTPDLAIVDKQPWRESRVQPKEVSEVAVAGVYARILASPSERR